MLVPSMLTDGRRVLFLDIIGHTTAEIVARLQVALMTLREQDELYGPLVDFEHPRQSSNAMTSIMPPLHHFLLAR